MPRIVRSDSPDGVVAIAPLQQSGSSSAPVLFRASDGRRYWCKVINNPQHPRVPINDQLVGRLGRLIGASTCDVALVMIPRDLAGWSFCRWNEGLRLEVGWAHGSAELPGAFETRAMSQRDADDNARRHASLYALYDWLCGEDPQWLVCGAEQNAYYSHDHGSYFPNGPAWSTESLARHAARAVRLPFPPHGLDPREVARLVDRLGEVREDELLAVGSALPASWPVTDRELEALVDFLLHRREATAERLRAMIGVSEKAQDHAV